MLEPEELVELHRRAPRLADLVRQGSRRSDCRRVRARILLLLLERRAPRGRRLRRPWYVPGAVARVGAEGLRRIWPDPHGPPTLRSMRSHLKALSDLGAILCSPGDWLPVTRDPLHPERRPRYPDTIHVIDRNSWAVWWARFRRYSPEVYRRARYSPDRWRQTFGADWAAGAVRQALAPLRGILERRRAPVPGGAWSATDIIRLVREPPESALGALAARGVRFGIQAGARFLLEPWRLAGALALAALATLRQSPPEDLGAWVATVGARASRYDLAGAIRAAGCVNPLNQE